jgi:hypothetical protein
MLVIIKGYDISYIRFSKTFKFNRFSNVTEYVEVDNECSNFMPQRILARMTLGKKKVPSIHIHTSHHICNIYTISHHIIYYIPSIHISHITYNI